MGQYIQEGSKILFETFIKTGQTEAAVQVEQNEKMDGFAYLEGKNFAQINEAAYKATLIAHSRRIPCMELQVEGMNEEHGRIVLFLRICLLFIGENSECKSL